MKQISIALISLTLVGCVNLGSPAKLGMNISEYQGTCGPDNSAIGKWDGPLVGECATKPQEYVVFTNGLVSNIYDAQGITDAMVEGGCKAKDDGCANDIRMFIAKRTSLKDKIVSGVKAARNQRLSGALAAFGESTRQAPTSAYSYGRATAPSTTMTCHLKGERESGMNKICTYSCLGSDYAVTQGLVSLCSLSIKR